MADKSRYFGLTLPQGNDSVVASAGLTQLNNFFDTMDTELNAVSNTGVAAFYLGVWAGSGTQSLASSATPANPTFTYSNVFTGTGAITPTFNTTGGGIVFGTAGFWRVTFTMVLSGMSALVGPTDGGTVVSGLKISGTAAFIPRLVKSSKMEIFAGTTYISNSFIVKADTASAEVDLTSTYYVATTQINSLASAGTLGGTDSWIAIEYMRAL